MSPSRHGGGTDGPDRYQNQEPASQRQHTGSAMPGGCISKYNPNGSKYWRLTYRFVGKEKRLAIGVYPKVTLKSARKACELTRAHLKQRVDSFQAKQARKVEQAQTNPRLQIMSSLG